MYIGKQDKKECNNRERFIDFQIMSRDNQDVINSSVLLTQGRFRISEGGFRVTVRH